MEKTIKLDQDQLNQIIAAILSTRFDKTESVTFEGKTIIDRHQSILDAYQEMLDKLSS